MHFFGTLCATRRKKNGEWHYYTWGGCCSVDDMICIKVLVPGTGTSNMVGVSPRTGETKDSSTGTGIPVCAK